MQPQSPARLLNEVLPASYTALARGGIAASQAALPPPLRKMHQQLLRAFLAAGAAPGPARLRELAADAGLDVAEAMASLAAADLVHTDPDGSIVVAYPLSGRSTGHTVHLDGLPSITAMCAIDALGIPMMAGRNGAIISADPTTNEPIRIELKAGAWSWQPSSTVLVLATSDACCAGPIAGACPLANFHASAELAEAYLAAKTGTTGRVLTREESVEIARNEFGPLLG